MIAEYIKLEWDQKRNTSIGIGALEVKARATIVPYRATVVARNAEVCRLDGVAQADTYDLSVAFANGESYLIKFWQQSTNLGTIKSLAKMAGNFVKGEGWGALDEMAPKIVNSNGVEAGNVQVPVIDDGIESYTYWSLQLGAKKLNCYIVGEGKSIYFCMYDVNQTMVATVEKRTPVKNGKSRYVMYIAQDDWLQPVVVMTSILHQQIYDEDDVQGLGSRSYRLDTFQKGLKDKFQPEFIEQIKNQEGAANWPENMTLVQDKIKESQNTLSLILKRIGLAIFLIVFIAIFAAAFLAGK